MEMPTINTSPNPELMAEQMEREKQMKLNSCKMLYRSWRQCKNANNAKTAAVMERQLNEAIEEYINLGGHREDIEKAEIEAEYTVNTPRFTDVPTIGNYQQMPNISPNFTNVDPYSYENISKMFGEEPEAQATEARPSNSSIPYVDIQPQEDKKVNLDDSISNNIKTDQRFDVIPLPSNGECYKNKLKAIEVAYLTAADEDFIMSPNLYQNGSIIDYLLKRKILTQGVNPENLCKGDRDAIILWLRATAYDPQFPVIVNDAKTGQEVEAVVDLSKIKTKPFNLKGDENGWFDFEMPSNGDKIKFKFLTRYDEKALDLYSKAEDSKARKNELKEIRDNLSTYLQAETSIDQNLRIKLANLIESITSWMNNIKDNQPVANTRSITNALMASIRAVNGNTDRGYIGRYVQNMPAMDSLRLRQYIAKNEPGMDFNVEAFKLKPDGTPGGESIKTFLAIDNTIFLNIA